VSVFLTKLTTSSPFSTAARPPNIPATRSTSPPDTSLPPVKILVADASAFSENYKVDRGVGALGGAKARIASKLIGELTREIDSAYRNLSGERPTEGPDKRPGVEIVYLPMPEVLRISSAFGTHWMMPKNIEIRNPETPYLKPRRCYRPNGCSVDNLRKQELLKAIDLIFANNEERGEYRQEFWTADLYFRLRPSD